MFCFFFLQQVLLREVSYSSENCPPPPTCLWPVRVPSDCARVLAVVDGGGGQCRDQRAVPKGLMGTDPSPHSPYSFKTIFKLSAQRRGSVMKKVEKTLP